MHLFIWHRTRLALAAFFVLMVAALAPARGQCWDFTDEFFELGPGGVYDIEAFTENGETSYYVAGAFTFLNPPCSGVLRLRSTTSGLVWENASPIPSNTFYGVTALQAFDDGTGNALFAATGESIYRYRNGAWTLFHTGITVDDFAVHNDGSGAALYIAGLSTLGYDLFRLTNGTWMPLSPLRAPPAIDFSFAYDPIRDEFIRFGGQTTQGVLLTPDTWTWTRSGGWAKRSIPGPSARTGAVLVWDPSTSRMALIGGQNANGPLADHWEWDGAAWSLKTIPTPAARAFASCAFDPLRSRLVLTCGTGAGGIQLADVWEWNGAAWTQIIPNSPVSPRSRAGFAFDPIQGKLVLTGVSGQNRTLTWDGAWWDDLSGIALGSNFIPYFDTSTNQLRKASVGGTGSVELFYFDPYQWRTFNPRLVSPPNLRPANAAFSSASQTLFISGANGELYERTATTWQAHQQFPLGASYRVKLFSVSGPEGPALYAFHLYSAPSASQVVSVLSGGQLQQFNLPIASSTFASGCVEGVPGQQRLVGTQLTGDAWRFSPTTGFQMLPSAGERVRAFTYGDIGNGPQIIAMFGDTVRTFDNGTWNTIFGPSPTIGQPLIASGTAQGVPHIFLASDGQTRFNALARSCLPIEITSQPVSVLARLQSPTVTFSVQVTGTPIITYAWRKNGVPLVDGPRVSGSSTRNLVVSSSLLSDAGTFDCVITNPVGTVTSNPATLTVRSVVLPPGPFTVEAVAISPASIDGPGAFDSLNWLYPPLLGRDGGVSFTASITDGSSNRNAIFENVPSLPLVVQSTQLPPIPGTITQVSNLSTLTGGGVLAEVTRTPSSTRTLFTMRSGVVTPVISSGGALPSLGYTALNQGFGNAMAEDDGTVHFRVRARHTSGTNSNAVYRWRPLEGMTEVVAPNLSINGSPVLQLNNAWRGRDDDRTVIQGTYGSVDGALAWRPSSIEPWQWIARAGQPIGASLPGQSFGSIQRMFLNDAGDGAFHSTSPYYIFTWNPETNVQFRIGPGFTTGLPSEIELSRGFVQGYNRSDEILFEGELRDAEELMTIASGLFLYSGSALRTIFETTMPEPAWLSSQNANTGLVRPPFGLSDTGEVLLHLDITIDNFASTGVFGWTPGSGLFPIAVPGMHFSLSDGTTRQVKEAIFTEDYSQNTSGLNHNHQFALRLSFVDNTGAILRGRFTPVLPDWRNCPTVLHGTPVVTLREGQTLSLERPAAGAQPLTLSWSRDGTPLTDGATSCGSTVSGASSSLLSITSVCRADAGTYLLTASNPCGQDTSDSITVYVTCTADIDGDDDGDSDDVIAFFIHWESGEPPADVDFDGDTDSDDIIVFFASWEAGC